MIKLKTLDEVVQSMINHIYDKIPLADTKQGTFIRDVFIDPVADEVDGLNIDMKMMEYNQSILTATGEDLDRLATNYNVTRKNATPATGTIRFYIKNINMDFMIQPSTQVATAPTYSEEARVYQTTNTKTIYYIHDKTNPPIDITNNDVLNMYLPIYQNNLKLGSNGYYYYDQGAKSINGGIFYNVAADNINKQVGSLDSNIQSFTNPIAFTGGTDKEKDTDLVMRIKYALQGANIGTKYGYLSHVLRQDGVEAAQVVAAMDEDMIRDITAGTYASDNLVHDGGKVDIYVKGQKTEQQTVQVEVNSSNIEINEEGRYTTLIIDPKYKPISKFESISWNTVDNFGILTNADDYAKEVTYAQFITFEDYTQMNITNYMKEAIVDFIDDMPDIDIYTFNPINKYNITGEIVKRTQTYGTVDDTSEYKYTYVTDDQEDVYTIQAPMQIVYYINDDNQIIFIEFRFMAPFYDSETSTNVYVQVGHVAVCYMNDSNDIANPGVNYYFYRNARDVNCEALSDVLFTEPNTKYYYDVYLTNDLLFPDMEEDLEINPDLDYLWKHSSEIPPSMSIQYLYNKLSDVKDTLLYDISVFQQKLDNFEYNIDLNTAVVNKQTIYNNPVLYTQYRVVDNYVYIDVKVSNNPNINNIKFGITITNEDNRIDLENTTWTVNNTDFSPITEHGYIDENIYIGNGFRWERTDATGEFCHIGSFRAPLLNLDRGLLMVDFNAVNILTDKGYVLQASPQSLMVNDDEIKEYNDDDIDLTMFTIYEYAIGTDIYKYIVHLPLQIDGESYNVELPFVKVNDNIYMRVYYTPDYQIVNVNQDLYGNSQNAMYRIKWFNDPLSIIGGNIYLTVNFETNTLIQEIQESIDSVKVLTADVLVKEAVEYPIEIVADICYDETYNQNETYDLVTSTIADYVNNNFTMGGTLKLAHLISRIQKINGVSYVDAATLQMRKMYGSNQKSITIHQYEYFKLKNLVLNTITD